jgi:hypothetical protein
MFLCDSHGTALQNYATVMFWATLREGLGMLIGQKRGFFGLLCGFFKKSLYLMGSPLNKIHLDKRANEFKVKHENF